ncbi:MAG: peptidoglycan DD-metalloendopeptidase family protein [Bdellovibrionales bacterium]
MKISRFSLLLCSLLLLEACTWNHPPAYQLPDSSRLIMGQAVLVKPGDNLYTLSQKYKVPLNDIVVVNNLQPPYRVTAGETIYLPEKVQAKTQYYAPPPKAAPIERVDVEPIQQYEITESKIDSVPLARAPMAEKKAEKQTKKKAAAEKQRAATEITKAEEAPKAPPPEKKKKKKQKAAVKKENAEVTEKAKKPTQPGVPPFIWPVRGTIISAFGPKGKGRDNDGINIAAPLNAPVKASESGTVVYADNKMKGFGNLVLIRHTNGWVTAYAHLGRVLVARDKQVSKGSVIGTVGTSGGVGSPQLHFETRREGKPTDPELVVR